MIIKLKIEHSGCQCDRKSRLIKKKKKTVALTLVLQSCFKKIHLTIFWFLFYLLPSFLFDFFWSQLTLQTHIRKVLGRVNPDNLQSPLQIHGSHACVALQQHSLEWEQDLISHLSPKTAFPYVVMSGSVHKLFTWHFTSASHAHFFTT